VGFEAYVVDDVVKDIVKYSDCLRDAVSSVLPSPRTHHKLKKGKGTNCCIDEEGPSPVAMTMPAGWKALSSDILNYAFKTRLSE